MESRTDKNSYTIIFAIIMVLVVGSLLAYAASSLKGRIGENWVVEIKVNGRLVFDDRADGVVGHLRDAELHKTLRAKPIGGAVRQVDVLESEAQHVAV